VSSANCAAEREAMWICFESSDKFAVKVYIGGVNAVSGEPSLETEQTKLRRYKLLSEKKTIQDYIVTPDQMWLDGVASTDGAVRQFVAVPLHSGYTVEAQITGDDLIGGLQLEVVPVKETCSIVVRPPSLEQINAAVAAQSAKTARFHILVKILVGPLTGKSVMLYASPSSTINKVKRVLEDHTGMSTHQQRLFHNACLLRDGSTLQDYSIANRSTLHLAEKLVGGGGGFREPAMGIATGGMIKQSVLRDNSDPNVWDPESGIILNVQILNSAVFEAMTGKPSPNTPVTADAYAKYGYSYYDIWNEKPSGIKGDFSGVKSVAEKDLEGPPTLEKPLAAEEVSKDIQSPVVLLDKTGGRVGFRPVRVMENELVEKLGKLDLTSKPGSKRKASEV